MKALTLCKLSDALLRSLKPVPGQCAQRPLLTELYACRSVSAGRPSVRHAGPGLFCRCAGRCGAQSEASTAAQPRRPRIPGRCWWPLSGQRKTCLQGPS